MAGFYTSLLACLLLEEAMVKNQPWDIMIWTSYRLPPLGTIQTFLDRCAQILVQIPTQIKTFIWHASRSQGNKLLPAPP
jgi:hypothetical protein